MKKVLSFFLVTSLFFLPFSGLMPAAQAHGWLWAKEGAGTGCEGWAIATDAIGNIYGAGINQYPTTPVTFGGFTIPAYTTGETYQSVWVKYDPSGAVLWAGGTTSGATCVQNIATDPAGNLIILGSFTSATMQIGSFTLTNIYTDESAQYFLAKISPAGDVLWAIKDGNTVPIIDIIFGMLGTGSVATDDTGNIYITSGFKKSSATFGATTLVNSDLSSSTYDVFLAKYSPSGVLRWITSIGGYQNDYVLGMTITSTNNIYIAGAFWSPEVHVGASTITNTYGDPLAYIAKFSSSGAPLWAQGLGESQAYASAVTKDNLDNIYLTGSFYDSTLSFGALDLHRVYSRSTAPALFLAKYAPNDTVTWAKVIESQSYQVLGYSLAFAPCAQEIWVTGDLYAPALVGAGDTITPSGEDPALIAGYNLAGDVVGYSALPSGGDDECEIVSDATGNIYLCGDFLGGGTVIGPDTLIGVGSEEGFYMAKYMNVSTVPDTTYAIHDTFATCTGAGIRLPGPRGFANYFWNNDSTSSAITVYASGKYFVYCVTCTSLQIDTFNVTLLMDTLSRHTDTVACAPSDLFSITLTAPVGINYNWYDGTTAATNIVSATGTYWVSYDTGCDFVLDTFSVIFTSSLPPCATGINKVSASAADDILFYPNPAANELTIKTDIGAYNSISVSNSIGQVFIQRNLGLTQTTIDVEQLPAGLYYLTFSGENGMAVKKFTKK